jgi:hypothetical protein
MSYLYQSSTIAYSKNKLLFPPKNKKTIKPAIFNFTLEMAKSPRMTTSADRIQQ